MFPTQTVHVLSIQVVLLLPLFFPAWSFSSPPTPSLLKFRFDHTPQFLFRAHYLSYFSLYEILMVPKGVFIQLLRPFFCFCFFCSFVLRDISVRVTSVGLLYTREFNPPPPPSLIMPGFGPTVILFCRLPYNIAPDYRSYVVV